MPEVTKDSRTLDKLTDTAQHVLMYLVQEPRAFVYVLKELNTRGRYNEKRQWSVSRAELQSRNMKTVYGPGYKVLNKASIAAMPNNGLLSEVPRPAGFKGYDRPGYDIKFYHLSDEGKRLGEGLLNGQQSHYSLRETAKMKVDQAGWSVRSAESQLQKAQEALSKAHAALTEATAEFAALGEHTLLTDKQAGILADVRNEEGDVLILGTENNAVLRYLSETEEGALIITKDTKLAAVTSLTLRPSLVLVEGIDDTNRGLYDIGRIVRDGGRIVATVDSLGVSDNEGISDEFGLESPAVIDGRDK